MGQNQSNRAESHLFRVPDLRSEVLLDHSALGVNLHAAFGGVALDIGAAIAEPIRADVVHLAVAVVRLVLDAELGDSAPAAAGQATVATGGAVRAQRARSVRRQRLCGHTSNLSDASPESKLRWELQFETDDFGTGK